MPTSGGNTTWPEVSDLKLRLNVPETDTQFDLQFESIVAAGIAAVKGLVGDWDESLDDPDEALTQAALEWAVALATTGEPPANAPITSRVEQAMYGHRHRFGVA
jgi:hypothetical protein